MPRHRVEVIDRVYAGVLAAKTPAERVAMASSAHRTARTIVLSRIAELGQDWEPAKKQQEFLRRMLGHGAVGHLEARG